MAPRFEHIFSEPVRVVRALVPAFTRPEFCDQDIALSGWPGDTTVVVEWRDTATLADGAPYVNDGVTSSGCAGKKVVSLRAYLDTEIYAEACRQLAANCFPEAVAPPIAD